MYKYLFIMFFSLIFIYSCNVNTEVQNEEVETKSISNVIKTLNLRTGVLNEGYRLNLRTDSHLIASEFFIYEGELPNGLELESSTGVISGTPKEVGQFNFKIALKEEDSNKMNIIPFNISIDKLSNLYKNIESFIDISRTESSNLHKVNDTHEITFTKPLFYFYGKPVSSLRICKEGYIKVNNGLCTPNTDINTNQDIIAPFADKELTMTPNSELYYQIRGASPRQMLIIQYKNIASTDDNLAEYNFEVIIHEESGNIQFLYDLSHSGLSSNLTHLGTRAFVGVTTNDKKYEVTKNQANIFRGTVITLHAPNANSTDNYNNDPKWASLNYITSNIVTDYVDISRYNKEATSCTSNSDCTVTDICIEGPEGKRCGAKDLTNTLMYDASYKAKLPFDFRFYGNTYQDFYINENGYVYFGLPNTTIPSFPKPNQLAKNISTFPINDSILPMFSDINVKIAKGGHITYNVIGQYPKRRAIVMYDEIRIDDDTNNIHNCSFELVLHEGSNVIEFLYGGNNESDVCQGRYSTVGIKKDSDDYTQISANQRVLGQGKSVTFIPNNLTATSYSWVGINNEREEVANSKETQASIYGSFSSEQPYWVDLSTIGTRATISGQDNVSQKASIGWNFNFMGTDYSDITISTNGGAIFEPTNQTTNLTTTNTDLSNVNINNLVTLFWDGLYSVDRNDANSGIFYHTMQNPLNPTKKIFILSYQNLRHFAYTSTHINAQMILSEGSSEILFCYGNLSGPYSLGDSATIGVRVNDTQNKTLSFNSAGVIYPGSCFSWSPPSQSGTVVRNLFKKEINSSFVDIPLRDIAINPTSTILGEDIEELYSDGSTMKPYSIYDLNGNAGNNYVFEFKGKTYDKLFVDGKGAVSFGNDETAELITAPLWGDVYYQSELESLSSPYEDVENDFMWIANSAADSLSKINTHTGTLIGEYSVGDNPSRTAVSFDGSVWVGNRNSHDVTKLDRNGNYICTVSLNSNCGPRGLALDKDENLWVGCYSGDYWSNWKKYIYKIVDTKVEPSALNNNASRCQILDLRAPGDNSTNLAFKGNNYRIYGFAFDKNGILWSSGIGEDIIRIDTNKLPGETGFYNHYGTPGGKTTYGIVVDYYDNLWYGSWYNGNTIGVIKAVYNANNTISSQTVTSLGNTPSGGGVAIDRHGNIWVAHGSSNQIGKYAPDGTALALFNINTNSGPNGAHNCDYPHGVGVDGDGDVWANCLNNGHSEELDPITGAELSNFYTGQSPYCYSDNTGFSLRNITSNLQKTQFYATISFQKVYDPNNPSVCERIEKKLIVQWNNVRLKSRTGNGSTKSTFQIIFDNGRSFQSPGANKCDLANLQALSGNRDVKITYAYGAVTGSDYNLKTGGMSENTLRAIYSSGENNIQYEHIIGNQDAGTINSGSKFVISSSK